jgi:hypothetical protein
MVSGLVGKYSSEVAEGELDQTKDNSFHLIFADFVFSCMQCPYMQQGFWASKLITCIDTT